MNFEIRKAKKEDFDTIFELLKNLYDQNKIDKNTISELFKLELNNPNTTQIIAIVDEKIVGFAAATN